MDVLTDVLNALALKGWISARRELAPPWRYDFAASPDMIFHLLSSGGGYLSLKETVMYGNTTQHENSRFQRRTPHLCGSRMGPSCSSLSGTLTRSVTN
jgi:Cupin